LLKGFSAPKIDQKTRSKNQNQADAAAKVFLQSETVTFCLNAPAGPSWRRADVVDEVETGTALSGKECV
jgi:hypothetical protein